MKGGQHPDENDSTGQKKDVEDKYTIPEYVEPKNNPMIPNEQKRIFSQRQAEKPNIKQQTQTQSRSNPNDPILNLQLYQQKPPRRETRPNAYPHPAVFYPNYVPNPFNPLEYANYIQYSRGYGGGAGPIPTYNEYNININGISGSHVKTSFIMEDSMPIKNVSYAFTSLGERQIMYEFIKSNIFPKGDGYDMPIDDSNYNILSHLKFMDLNPYNSSRFYRNPYRGLPFGFLLYRSCYPIRHDQRTASTICAKNSTGINVRIYRMTEGAYKINRINKNLYDHDLWREVA